MEACKQRWSSWVDACRLTPVLPYEKVNCIPEGKFGRDDMDNSERRKLWAALIAEFLGLFIFQLYGGEAHESVAAFGNGLTLAVCVYATANISGGHLNPAVTLATIISGHMHWKRGLLYILAQFGGAVMGALFQAALLDTAWVGMGNSGPGCFTHLGGVPVTEGQLFGWELIMTFVLVFVVYSCCISKPGFGNIGPLAVGYTLFASAFVGGPMTGTAINPARVFGPALVFNCYWSTAFVYMAAQFAGGAIAALLSMPLWGPGDHMSGESQEIQTLRAHMEVPPPPPAMPVCIKAERQGLVAAVEMHVDAASRGQWQARFEH